MKRKKLLLISLFLIAVLSFAIISVLTINAKASQRISELKNTYGLEVSINHNKDNVDKKTAYKIAEKYTNNLSEKAKDILIEHYFLTDSEILPAAYSEKAKAANPKLEKGINKLPVWIVFYEGVKSPAHSLPESKITPNPTQTVITVIDAATGEVIFGYGNRININK